jgi:hypothetical protein
VLKLYIIFSSEEENRLEAYPTLNL